MNKKLFGFTLAEVLITLAIIGVVAALTLPTLLANYQKKEFATKAIKTYAEIQQAFNLFMANDNTSQLSQTKPWSNMTKNCNSNNLTNTYCLSATQEFQKIFNSTTIVPATDIYIESEDTFWNPGYGLKLQNGIIIYPSRFLDPKVSEYNIDALGGNMKTWLGYMHFDVNGEKGPNRAGIDVFSTQFDDRGILYPNGGLDFSLYYCGDKSCMWNVENHQKTCLDKKSFGCLARILEQGKMDY